MLYSSLKSMNYNAVLFISAGVFYQSIYLNTINFCYDVWCGVCGLLCSYAYCYTHQYNISNLLVLDPFNKLIKTRISLKRWWRNHLYGPNRICLFLVAVAVDAVIVCPPAAAYSPCECIENNSAERPGTIALDCLFKSLVDSKISEILDAFLTTPGISPLVRLELGGNQLTFIPDQI